VGVEVLLELLVAKVDVTPSKPGDQTDSGLSGKVYGAIAALSCG
jgi:hypothetical protein